MNVSRYCFFRQAAGAEGRTTSARPRCCRQRTRPPGRSPPAACIVERQVAWTIQRRQNDGSAARRRARVAGSGSRHAQTAAVNVVCRRHDAVYLTIHVLSAIQTDSNVNHHAIVMSTRATRRACVNRRYRQNAAGTVPVHAKRCVGGMQTHGKAVRRNGSRRVCVSAQRKKCVCAGSRRHKV